MKLATYDCGPHYDEWFDESGRPRPRTEMLARRLEELSEGELALRQKSADVTLRNMGITFNVYGHESGTEKVWPFDILPRIVEHAEWETIERGLQQRITALNLFIGDVYNGQKILNDTVVPAELVLSAKAFREQMRGFTPPKGVWCHVTGTDLVRDHDGKFYVLEDNLRCPSGVSYVLENREVMKRTFPQVFQGMSVAPVEDYPEKLLDTLLNAAPETASRPTAVVLTPGFYNSAYYEHSFLAQRMGVELVQGSDLLVSDGYVYMRTTKGLRRVDAIYRRIDDDFLDPKVFRADSMLGVPGLMEAYRKGRVALANAPGTGIADDKAVYAYVPEIIRYYLSEEPILPNVPTYLCSKDDDRRYVLEHLHELVVKPTNESGGYGIMIGPKCTREEQEECGRLIRENARNYIAQPMLSLSTVPTVVEEQLEPRHVDLRPFILSGKSVWVLPGGLTRVALKKGSLIVNSSQGGGSKDTWLLSSRHRLGNGPNGRTNGGGAS